MINTLIAAYLQAQEPDNAEDGQEQSLDHLRRHRMWEDHSSPQVHPRVS